MEIEIKQEVNFNELCSRLRNVSLRGFPNVKIYGNALIDIRPLSPLQVKSELFTPQPSVYTDFLDKISRLAELFSQRGVDIFNLNGGVDYTSTDEKGEVTDWTMVPPVVEVFPVFFKWVKGLNYSLDYSSSISPEVISLMKKNGFELNPELQDLDYPEYQKFKGKTQKVSEICDGSHRVEAGVRRGLEQNILFIDSPVWGYPYYAAPKPYSTVHEESDRDKSDKTHVLTSPGHKLLYRLFPSGGILSGTVRPPTSKEKFI
ncbi:MAG: hypothetical protein Q7S06_03295 [Nanoarchaeota archaeon]|nr:hypothetical protein [Nanoarchaeota archaeon]